jgi:branched-chain amino acid transport system substrate-binding protein
MLLLASSGALLSAQARDARASQAADAGDLRFGMSTVLTGPAAGLGLAMRRGVEAAFAEANAAGGVGGRKLVLIALDDGYEPRRAEPNMRKLVDDDGVLGVVGNVGTPTAVASIPVALEKKTLFFGAFTGAGLLRKTPPDRYVVNFRASYAQETSAMVDALVGVAGLEPEEIAFFTQRDAYGDAGFAGGMAALKRRGLKDEGRVAHGRYERNTIAVEGGLADLLSAAVRPRAVIMVGAYAPCAEFIKLARTTGLDARFLNVSFVGTQPLIDALGPAGEGVVITQVVPPLDTDQPIHREFRVALAASAPEATPDLGGLEGYVATRVLVRALKAVRGPPTREGVVDALEGLGTFDLGLGAPLTLGPDRHQACDRVWPTVVKDGAARAMDWSELVRSRTDAASESRPKTREARTDSRPETP